MRLVAIALTLLTASAAAAQGLPEPPPSEVPPAPEDVREYRERVLVIRRANGKLHVSRAGEELSRAEVLEITGYYVPPRSNRTTVIRAGLVASGAAMLMTGVYWITSGPMDDCAGGSPEVMDVCRDGAEQKRLTIGVAITAGGALLAAIGLGLSGPSAPSVSDTELEVLVLRHNARLRRNLGVGAEDRAALELLPLVGADGGGIALRGTF